MLKTAGASKGRGRRGRSQGRSWRLQRRTGGRTISGGDRAVRGLNNLGPLRIRVRSKALKARARFWSPWVKLGAGSGLERQEGNGERRARAAVRGGNPLKREPRTWQRGETNPQGRWRRKPSRTCETSRAERCGPGMSAAWMGQPIRWWTPPADVAKGAEPQGRCSAPGGDGRAVSENSEEGRSAREDRPTAKVVGDGSGRKTAKASRKRQRQGGIRQPDGPGTPLLTTL